MILVGNKKMADTLGMLEWLRELRSGAELEPLRRGRSRGAEACLCLIPHLVVSFFGLCVDFPLVLCRGTCVQSWECLHAATVGGVSGVRK